MENAKQYEKLSCDCGVDVNKPVTNNVIGQFDDTSDIAEEQQEDNRESKVVNEEKQFDELDVGISTKVEIGEEMTSFPGVSNDAQSTGISKAVVKGDENDNSSHGSVSAVAGITSDPLSPVDDLSQMKKQTTQSELILYCTSSFLYSVRLDKTCHSLMISLNLYFICFF